MWVQSACASRYPCGVAKTVQIREVDEHTYATLRQRAAAAGLSLSQYLRRELDHLASVPSTADWLAQTDRWRERYRGIDRDLLVATLEEGRTERDIV